MNPFSPELFMLSGRIALLVLIASGLAFFAGRLSRRKPASVLPPETATAVPVIPFSASEDLIRVRTQAQELRQALASTESQCVSALEQRDEAERQAVSRSEEIRNLKEELARVKSLQVVSQQEYQAILEQSQQLQRQREEADESVHALKLQLTQSQSLLDSRQSENEEKQVEVERLQKEASTANQLTITLEEQLERVTREKTERETLLSERILALESAAAASTHEPVGQHPKRQGESLFDATAIASFSPDIPGLDAAEATLAGLKLELQAKDREIEILQAEQNRRREEVESVRHSPIEEQQSKLQPAEKAERIASAQLTTAIEERDRCRRQVRALTRSLVLAAEHTCRADDLTRIKGIKGGISQQLHAFGIFTYRQIVEWDAEDMLAFGELLAFKNRLHRDKWQDQARALMEAKYGGRS